MREPRCYGVQRLCQSHKPTALGAFQGQDVSLIDVQDIFWVNLIASFPANSMKLGGVV